MKRVKDKDIKSRLARSVADYQNLVKRVEKEKSLIISRANKDLVEELLPVLDIFEKAQDHLKNEGLKMGIEEFLRVLQNSGVEKIDTKEGDRFNPEVHEAIEVVDPQAGGGKPATIAKVLLEGYKWSENGEVLRHTRVKVFGKRSGKEGELDKEMTRGEYV